MSDTVDVTPPPPVASPGSECPTCGPDGSPSFVYVIGQIKPRCPTLALEKEYAQATGRSDTTGLTDPQALSRVLGDRANRYLARQWCWVLTVEGVETYLLVPRDRADLDLLIEAIRAEPSKTDLDVVIGTLGPVAPPTMCNGLMVPIVVFDQIYSFDHEALTRAIPRPEAIPEERFRAVADEVLSRIMLMADNAGAMDEHRALNYLAVRYDRIYPLAAEQYAQNASLASIEVRPSALSGVRRIVEVIFRFIHRQTDVTEAYFVRVDVTEQFPFLVTKLTPFLDR
jgi:hypothetical protein